jgi:hypothetical protein
VAPEVHFGTPHIFPTINGKIDEEIMGTSMESMEKSQIALARPNSASQFRVLIELLKNHSETLLT